MHELTRIEDKLDKVLDHLREIKTRLADEERDDQKDKATARYKLKVHEDGSRGLTKEDDE